VAGARERRPAPGSLEQELSAHSARVSFPESAEILPRLLAMGGLAYAEAVRDGRLPPDPFIEAMGFRLAEVAPGHVTYAAVPAAHHLNIAGTMHGGYMCALLDCATGYAMLTTHSSGAPLRTCPLATSSWAPCQADRRFGARAICLGRGDALGMSAVSCAERTDDFSQ
jgi:acyl-coenzyme A thioesterase PaaI-like protein